MAQLFNHILCPVDFSEPSGAALKIDGLPGEISVEGEIALG